MSILEKAAGNKEIWSLIRLMFNSMDKSTYYSLLSNDEQYQNALKQMENIENAMNTLDISPGIQNYLDDYFVCNDEMHDESMCTAYLAGIIDGYRILQKFNLLLE